MLCEIHMFPCLTDNYGFLIHDKSTGLTAAIDSPEVSAINAALIQKHWKLTHIFNTHHHYDHAGGNLELKERWKCKIVGAACDEKRIPGIDQKVVDGDRFEFGETEVKVFEVPGHTKGHIAYYFASEHMVFVGDTIFSMGCGRLFEGTADQMWCSLQKLMTLPADTKIYCAHEYTESNANFAITVDPDNSLLKTRVKEVRELQQILGIPNNKVWLMPEGLVSEELTSRRRWLMELCQNYGYNYTDRLHIIAYGDIRGV